MQQQTVEKTPAAPGAAQRDAKGNQTAPVAAQRAAQQNYLRSLRPGPVEQAAPGAPLPPPAAAGAPGAAAPGALVPQKQGLWARAKGAVQGAAHWAGDKATQAKQATVNAYHSTTKAVGEAWDKTKQVAGDVYDVAKNTSVGYANGKIAGKTNVAEVADLLPQQYRDAMAFDKTAKNDVTVEYDVHTGLMTAKAASLTLTKLAMGPLNAGPTTLSDVVITLNRDNKAAAEKGAPAAEGRKVDNMHATIHVGRVLATQVAYTGPRGLLKAAQVELAGLDASAFNPGGGTPMLDDKKDHLVGTFALEKATVRGLSGDAASAQEISTTKIAGGIDQDKGTAYAEMGGTDVKQGRFGQRTVEQASVRDARVGVQGKAGNLPGIENARDPLKVDARVGHADVKGVAAPEGSVRAASIDGVTAQYDMASPDAKASVAAARLEGAQLGGTKLKSAQLTNLQAAREGNKVSGSVDEASMSGLKGKAASADAASVHGARGSYDLQSGDATLGLKSGRADGLKAGKNGAQSVTLSGLAATRQGDHVSADLASAEVRGAKAGTAGGDVKVAGVHAAGNMADKSGSARAAVIEGKNLKAGENGAKTARIDAAHAAIDAKGNVSGGLKSAQATGVNVAGERIESVGLDGLSGRRDASGHTTAELEAARAQGITGDKLRAQSLNAQGLKASGDAKGGSLSAARVSGERIGAGTVSADKADFQALAVTGGKGGTGSVTTAQGHVEGLAVGDSFKAKQLSTTQLAVARDAKTTTASAATLKGAGIQSGTNTVGTLDAQGVDTGFGGTNGKARVDAKSIGVTDARFGEVGLGAGRVEGAGMKIAQSGKLSTQADALHAEKLTTPSFKVAQVDAHGLATKQTDQATDVRAADVAVRKAAVSTDALTASADEAHVKGGHAVIGRDGQVQAEVAKVGGRGIAFEGGGNAAKSTPAAQSTSARASTTTTPATRTNTEPAPATATSAQSGLTKGALVRGLSQRVEEVDAKFSAPMRETSEGPVTVDKGTRLNAEVHARDNKLVPGQTGVNFSQDLDGPAWIGVKGAKLEADKKSARGGKPATQGRVEADLSGFWDQDVTGKVNDQLGRKDQDTIPLSISELGDLAGKKMDQDAAPATTPSTPAAPTRAGVRGRTPPRRETPAPVQQPTPAKPGPIDMDQAELDARVKLSAGRVPLGGRQHVDIGQAGKGGNTINVRARGGEDMVVDMTQVVLGSLNVQAGKGKKVKADGAKVDDAKVQVGTGTNAGKFKGSIGSFETEGVGVE